MFCSVKFSPSRGILSRPYVNQGWIRVGTASGILKVGGSNI